jgi:hypothetical protein
MPGLFPELDVLKFLGTCQFSYSSFLNLSSNKALKEDGSNAFILYFATLVGGM